MNNKNILLTLVLTTAFLGVPAYGKQATAKGQPFVALQEQIDANRTLIEANASAIESLNQNTATLLERINAIEISIDGLSDQVAENTIEIGKALDQITTANGEIAALYSELGHLAARHDAELIEVNQQLATIGAELDNLNTLRNELADQLSAALASLNSQVSDNTIAIDSLVLELLNVNAQLTIVNSDIFGLENRSSALEEAQSTYADQLSELADFVSGLESTVTTLQSYHLFTFSGIQTSLPVSSLVGWSQCYSASYASQNAHPEDMVAVCTGSKIMLACRRTGADTLTVAAYANREDVFMNTGDRNDNVHRANGVDWYFSYNWSMGFAPAGAGVRRNSADIKFNEADQRLSWHTKDNYTTGWRCGSSINLNYNSNWEKLIFQAD